MTAQPEPVAATHVPFADLLDLAAEAIGGAAELANDEFFAPKESLVMPGRGYFDPERFTDRGKWMDGWETRRRREPGYDWCILRLGARGRIHGVDVDTNHFLGNFPERCSLDVCDAPGAAAADLADTPDRWREVLAPADLQGGSRNLFPVLDREPATHVRLNIYPDGGVARLRVHGEVVPTWVDVVGGASEPVDLASVLNGGSVVTCNDMFFGTKDNLLMPGPPRNMGEGWETRRRRRPGNDWIVVRLGAPGQLQRLEIHTTHFKGNCPESASVEWCSLDEDVASHANFAIDDLGWAPLLERSPLEPHHTHSFDALAAHAGATHLRLNIFPDGGVARLRVFGTPGTRA